MSDLRDLYQQVIVDHSKRPRNYYRLESANRSAAGFNPLCGDEVKVYLNIIDGVVHAVSFEGSGCAISTASASLMTGAVKARSEAEVEILFQCFHDLITGQNSDIQKLGKLAVFAGVCEFPVRVKCASLVWHTLRNAMNSKINVVSTEWGS
jgi:nitrogen fixation protein NifU and related proteins